LLNAKAGIHDIRNHSDDGHPLRRVAAASNLVTDRTFMRPELARKATTHHAHQWCPRLVSVIDGAALYNRDAQNIKVPGSDVPDVGRFGA